MIESIIISEKTLSNNTIRSYFNSGVKKFKIMILNQ